MANSDSGSATDDTNTEDTDSETPDAKLERLEVKYGLEKKHRKNAETKYSEVEKRLQTLEESISSKEKAAAEKIAAAEMESHKKSGDMDSFTASMNELRAKDKSEADKEKAVLNKEIGRLTSGRAASDFAQEHFGKNAAFAMPHVEKRFTSKMVDGKSQTIILDESGSETAMNVSDLLNHFSSQEQFKPYLVGSQASGGGANGSNARNNGGSAAKKMEGDALRALPEPERKAFFKSGGKLK